jgi:hypothetical protein
MMEFRVQLFPKEAVKPKGLFRGLKRVLVGLPKPNQGDALDLQVGDLTEHGFCCVDVYYRGVLIGEIKKKGIDELVEKGALAGARYFDKTRITISRLEPHQYRNTPEYKAWLEKRGP